MRILALLLLFLMGGARALAADGAALQRHRLSRPTGATSPSSNMACRTASGFPYWDVFVIDLKNNEWVKGSPVRVCAGGGRARSLADARDKARTAAAGRLRQANVTEPADAARRQSGNRSAWPCASASHSTAGTPAWGAAGADEATEAPAPRAVSCENVDLPRPAGCPRSDGDTYGFALTLKDSTTRQCTRVIHEDTRSPPRAMPAGL